MGGDHKIFALHTFTEGTPFSRGIIDGATTAQT
jgi:hypothetical protein